MKDFIMAALPWICIGVVLAIFAVAVSNKANNKTKADADTKGSEKEDDNYMLIPNE